MGVGVRLTTDIVTTKGKKLRMIKIDAIDPRGVAAEVSDCALVLPVYEAIM